MKRALAVALTVALTVARASAQTGPIVPYSSQTPTFAICTATLAATGTTQATAALIAAQDVTITTGSSTAYGVVLPAIVGLHYTVRNRSGVSISVYPPGFAQIENGGPGNPAILPSGADATYISYAVGQWQS